MTTPIRTSAADRNVLSLTGGPSVLWYAGTEDAHEGSLPYPITIAPPDPKAWSSALKCSGAFDLQLTGIRAAQCMENAVDINNVSHDIALEGRFGDGGLPSGDQVVTIKGGSHHIALKGSVCSEGRKAHITIGCWSDQSTAPVHHIDLSLLRHHTGRPLTVVFGRADRSTIALPPGAKVLWGASICETLYWWAKRAYVAVRYRRW